MPRDVSPARPIGAHGGSGACGSSVTDAGVTAAARSHGESDTLLAVGDKHQALRLLPYPCLTSDAELLGAAAAEGVVGARHGGHAEALYAVLLSASRSGHDTSRTRLT